MRIGLPSERDRARAHDLFLGRNRRIAQEAEALDVDLWVVHVPLMNGLGVQTNWYCINADQDFFQVNDKYLSLTWREFCAARSHYISSEP